MRNGLCRATQTSLLRLLTQKIAPDFVPLTNHQAWDIYSKIIADELIGYVAEPYGVELIWQRMTDVHQSSPKTWMDAYLAAFATSAELTIVTLDKDFRNYEPHGLNLLLLS